MNETPYNESNAILAAIRDDDDQVDRILAEMLPGELLTLADACADLRRAALDHYRTKKSAEGGAR